MSGEGLRKLPYKKTEEYAYPDKGWHNPNREVDPVVRESANDAQELIEEPYVELTDEELEIENLERRNLIVGSAATAVLGAGAVGSIFRDDNPQLLVHENTPTSPKSAEEHHTLRAALEKQVHRLREREVNLANMPEGFGMYFGVHPHTKKDRYGEVMRNKDGTIVYEANPFPAEPVTIRPDIVSENLWREKNAKYPNVRNEKLAKELNESYARELERDEEHRVTLQQHIRECEETVKNIRTATDWEKVAILYGFENGSEVKNESERRHKAHECIQTLETLATQIDGQLLTSFSMTEIMSRSNDAGKNAAAFNLGLQAMGTGFITRIPALYDNQPSFGAYQHTPYAMNIRKTTRKVKQPDGKVKEELHTEYDGASKMNRAISPELQIPVEMQVPEGYGKFTDIKDQHTFAYLFALHNIAETIDTLYRLNPTLVSAMKNISKETLMEFIATSHHKPHPSSDAILAMLRHLKKGKVESYQSECPKDLQIYALRTVQNHQALSAYA